MEKNSLVALNIELVKSFVEEAINGANLNAIDKYWAEDMVWKGGSLGTYQGLAAYKEMAAANIGKAFTNMHLEIKDIIASGNKVVLHFTNSGLNSGSFMGRPATNKNIVWQGMAIYKIAEGKIIEGTFSEDILDIFIKLGFLN